MDRAVNYSSWPHKESDTTERLSVRMCEHTHKHTHTANEYIFDSYPNWSVCIHTLYMYAATAKLLQSCPTLCNPIDGSPPGSHPWDSPGKNTGVGCHFLLRCVKVKSESEVAQSCPTPSDPMDGSLPGPSVHGIFQARVYMYTYI